MTAVRMGERVLQIGINDPALAAVLAARTGLSGHAVIVVPDDARAERARRACADNGTLAEIVVTPLDRLPLETADIDVVIVHSVDNLLGELDAMTLAALTRECRRVLRVGGRLIVIEAGERSRLAALLGKGASATRSTEASVQTLEAAGFRTARIIGDSEGLRFTEGLKAE